MQSIEDFLEDYFCARTDCDKTVGHIYKQLAARFLKPGYHFYNLEERIGQSEAESILVCDVHETEAWAITSGCYGGSHRMRYHLLVVDRAWRIVGIELECGICHGSGKRKGQMSECRICNGKGWNHIAVASDGGAASA